MPEQFKSDEFRSWSPFATLFKREIMRFVSVSVQTIITPVVTASLYLFIFGLHLGAALSVMEGITYIQFVVPGLVLMGVMNNCFANTSSSLFFYRYMNGIVELLTIPISPFFFGLAFTLAAIVRGLLVGSVVMVISLLFTDLPFAHPWQALSLVLVASYLFAQFGIIAAIYSATFDHLTMFTNFLILPLIYLGGMFYPVSMLPPLWQSFSKLNPIYYLIDGFRQSIVGKGENSFALNFSVALGLALVLGAFASYLIWKSKRLRV